MTVEDALKFFADQKQKATLDKDKALKAIQTIGGAWARLPSVPPKPKEQP